MFALTLITFTLAVPEPITWHTNFLKASLLAKEQKKDLVIHFRADDSLDKALDAPEVRDRLKRFVCVRLPMDYVYKGEKMIDRAPLSAMLGKPGLCIVSRHDDSLASHDQVISAHPLVGSHYRWAPSLDAEHIAMILDLPAKATLSQRCMIYAVTVHPDGPRSINGSAHPAFLGHAEGHCGRQATLCNQHHANLLDAMRVLGGQVGGVGNASEVVAESWGGEHVLEAAYSCVDAWRCSTGHWNSVMSEHRYFGYDIAQGSDGKWYATGIFAD
jgi:hypothetical protein